MNKRNSFFVFIFLLWQTLPAQDSTRYRLFPFSVSIFNNQTSLPVGMKLGMTQSPVHPGICFSYLRTWQNEARHEWQQSFKLGYYYHQYSQHGIQLYTEMCYRYKPFKWLYPEAGLGAGYLHAISDLQQFELNSNGQYEKKKSIGRPQCMISTFIGLSVPLHKKTKPTEPTCTACRKGNYSMPPNRIFITYQLWMQMPFVKNYVPLLPNTALHIGYAFTLKQKVEGGKK
ncbi:MAG: hypothetical protein K1X81_02875 [Bacteroidia bacterium]|nr:hypothetical protein [Bacteroidia bacterium]